MFSKLVTKVTKTLRVLDFNSLHAAHGLVVANLPLCVLSGPCAADCC